MYSLLESCPAAKSISDRSVFMSRNSFNESVNSTPLFALSQSYLFLFIYLFYLS